MKLKLKSYLSELLHNPELVIALIQLFYDGNNVVTIGIISILKSFENIRFISLNENLDSSKRNSQDAYLAPLVSLFNNWYSLQCSEKIKLSKHTKAKTGEKIGWIVPYGYLKSPENPKEWRIDDYASQIVKRVFREYLD